MIQHLLAIALLAGASIASPAQAAKYLKLNKNGTGNMVFSDAVIKKNEEGRNALRTSFGSGDTIYARAYFSKKMGEFQGEEEGFIDVWIDGKHEKRINFTNQSVPADRDQMLIYVYNTKDYPPDFKDDVWSGLSSGKHEVHLVVGRTKFLRKGASAEFVGDKLVVRRDDPHTAVYLSEATFSFTKD